MRRFAMGARVRSGVATCVWALVLALLMASGPAEAKRRSPKGGGYAPPQSAMVLDPVSGKVLYASDVDGLRHPASLTKVMTLFLLFEQIEKGAVKLDTPFQVSANAMNQAPSRLGVKKGETISVDDAIKAIVTRSANDVAVVIAENLAGSEKAFAERMTEKAQELGMRNTVFVNASGLPNKAQITTARDLATLGKAVRERFPELFGYFATRSFDYAGAKVPSHNRLMNRLEGMDGIKTGFTNASGFNLLASVRRGEKSVIAVVMGGITQKSRDDQMAELVNRFIEQAAPAPAPLVASQGKPAALAFAEQPKPVTFAATGPSASTPSGASVVAPPASPAATAPTTAAPAKATTAATAPDPVVTGSIASQRAAEIGAPTGLAHSIAVSLAGVLSLGGLMMARRRFHFAVPGAASVGRAWTVTRIVGEHIGESIADSRPVAQLRTLSAKRRARAAAAQTAAAETPSRAEPSTAGPWLPPDALR